MFPWQVRRRYSFAHLFACLFVTNLLRLVCAFAYTRTLMSQIPLVQIIRERKDFGLTCTEHAVSGHYEGYIVGPLYLNVSQQLFDQTSCLTM